MTAYIIRRLWQMIPTMLGVMLLVFLLFHTFAGDPAQVLAGKISNKADIENIRKQLGVDEPYWKQMAISPVTNAKGYRWQDRAGEWIDYNTQGQVVAWGDQNDNVVWLVRVL